MVNSDHAVRAGFYKWVPHYEKTWTHKFARLKKPIELKHFCGHGKNGPVYLTIPCTAGDLVKIVMVSRFGDVGITEKLDAEYGYGARLSIEDLYDFMTEPPNGNI